MVSNPSIRPGVDVVFGTDSYDEWQHLMSRVTVGNGPQIGFAMLRAMHGWVLSCELTTRDIHSGQSVEIRAAGRVPQRPDDDTLQSMRLMANGVLLHELAESLLLDGRQVIDPHVPERSLVLDTTPYQATEASIRAFLDRLACRPGLPLSFSQVSTWLYCTHGYESLTPSVGKMISGVVSDHDLFYACRSLAGNLLAQVFDDNFLIDNRRVIQ